MSGVMASSDGSEGAVKMGLDGADRQSGYAGDFRQFQLLEEAKKKYTSLPIGELRDALPNQRHLLAGDEARLQRAVAMRNVRRDVGHVDRGLRDPFPEAKAVSPGVIANQVQSDPHQPCRDRAVSPKGLAGGPGADKCVLGQRLGDITVTDRNQMEAKDSLLVGGD